LLTSLSPALTLLVGIALLSETVNWIGVVGILITIVGTMYISLGRVSNHSNGVLITKKENNKAVLFGVLAASCHGIGIALSKKGILEFIDSGVSIQPISASFIRILFAFFGIIILFLISSYRKRELLPIFKSNENNRLIIFGTIFNPTMGVIMSMYSIAYLNVAVAQTFFSLVPLIALLIAFFYYKEKITFRSALGVGFALLGVVVLIWRNDIHQFVQKII
jgi:drug/metabolite transporter (DMT)-like permease